MLIDVLFLSFGTPQYNYAACSLAKKLKTNVYLIYPTMPVLTRITAPQRVQEAKAWE
jgi:hypothetical protein